VLLLDNQGKLTAATTGGEGNINLRSLNLLILRGGSAITTSATGNNITGGNINIDAKNGFIVAVLGKIAILVLILLIFAAEM
jgi:large exoprotein involved in heme utilization and adhesion